MESQPSSGRLDAAITILSRPHLLLQGTVEYFLAWIFTRRWWSLFWIHSAWIVLLTAVVGLVGYGAFLSRQTLGDRYSDWVEEELPEVLRSSDENAPSPSAPSQPASAIASSATDGQQASSDGDNPEANGSSGSPSADGQTTDTDAESVSQYGDLLLRRLLQLQDSNSRITYLVAAQLARQQRLAQARQLMRRIAPVPEGGFIPAHHWLAGDQLSNLQIRTAEDRERLLKDLALAVRWPGCHPALRSFYSQLLESQGDVPQAMAVLEQAAQDESNIDAKLGIARLAAKHGERARLERVSAEIKEEIRRRVEAETADSLDWARLANLWLIEQQPAQARKAAESGLKKDPEHPQLRRLLSESYRMEYLMSIQQDGGKTKLKLGLLDAALKSDPSNPSVGVEIARLMNLGQDTTPELQEALEKQLAAGQATALTHILLANRQLVNGDLKAAAPHLELALRQAPNSPTVMNNLALVLARTNQQLDRALELANAAVGAIPGNPEFRDTLGEVRHTTGDQLGAIDSYEAAIGIDGSRVGTRRKLIALYRELGMQDMADVQEAALRTLQAAPATDQPALEQPALEQPTLEQTSEQPSEPAAIAPSVEGE
jgi:hypothetical protein